MKPDYIYNELIQLANKLGTPVSEHNFRTAGIHVRSGYCKVHGKNLFIIDKHLKLSKKVEILADFLSTQPIDDIFVVPALRELLERSQPRYAAHARRDAHSKNSINL
jgi:hypothetical protein